MKKLASKFITGILIATVICSGSLGLVTESSADDGHNGMMIHTMQDETVNCCDDHDHDHEHRLLAHKSEDEHGMNIKITAVFPYENFPPLIQSILSHDDAESSATNKTNSRLRAVVRLE